MPLNYASCWILFVCACTPEDNDKKYSKVEIGIKPKFGN